ncbi:hypothetical protein TNCV_561011 [Trichonephila clavipes]|nr:hypothetical protein TNCV_561011 [Trichonephila clavipes]
MPEITEGLQNFKSRKQTSARVWRHKPHSFEPQSSGENGALAVAPHSSTPLQGRILSLNRLTRMAETTPATS